MADLCTCVHQLQPHARLESVCPPPLDKHEIMAFEDWKRWTFTDDDPREGHEPPTKETY